MPILQKGEFISCKTKTQKKQRKSIYIQKSVISAEDWLSTQTTTLFTGNRMEAGNVICVRSVEVTLEQKWLEAKAAGDKEIHDHIGSVRIGTLCFDLIERKGKRDKNYLYADLYVGGIDTGYGYGKDDYPYTYVDWISRQWTVDKLPKDYRSFKKEIEEKLTMLIKHARSITLKRKQYSLQEKNLDDVKIW